ncbi:MAG TPA: transposase [Burkholderiaceae bacterium]|nr:transposase [Burkholderiaceae bacterium]
MNYDPAIHHRRSIRLPGYDYAQAGAYFVTVCTSDRELPLGEVVDGEMQMSHVGCMADMACCWLAGQYAYVHLDAYIVMPNHVHAILWIIDELVQAACGPHPRPAKRKPLGRLVGAFKTVSTNWANHFRGTPGEPLWQRNYYEHIVRTERALKAIRRYIIENPLRWELDRYNPAATGPDPDARDLWRLLQEDL